MNKTYKAIRTTILSVLVSAAAAVLWLLFLDGSFTTGHSIKMNKTPMEVAQIISDIKSWHQWSPWLNSGVTTDNKQIETDSTLSWPHVLGGTVRITRPESQSNDTLLTLNQKLSFTKPFACNATIRWSIKPNQQGSEVTMQIEGILPFWYRALTQRIEAILYMDIDRSLNTLQDFAEKGEVLSETQIEGITTNPQLYYIGIRNSCPVNDLDSVMQNTFIELTRLLQLNEVESTGTLSSYYDFGINADKKCDFLCAAILPHPLEKRIEGVEQGRIKETKALKIRFSGEYKHIANAWVSGLTYIRAKGLKQRKKIRPYEIYIQTDANSQSPYEWQTELYIPVR